MSHIENSIKVAIKLLEGILNGEVDRIDSGLCLYINPHDSAPLTALIEYLNSKWDKASPSNNYVIPDPNITIDKGFKYSDVLKGSIVIYEEYKLKKLNFIDKSTEYGLLRLELAQYLLTKLKARKTVYEGMELCLDY